MEKKGEYKKKFYQLYGSEIENVNMDKIVYLLEKAVKTNKPKILSYLKIVEIGARKKGEKINDDEFCELLKKIFEYWIEHNIKERAKTAEYEFEQKRFAELLEIYEEYQKNKAEFDINDFWQFQGDNWIEGRKSPIYFQGQYFCHFYANVLSTDRFQFDRQSYDARLYLNIKVKNAVSLAQLFIKKAVEKEIPLTFKIGFGDDRNDNFVLYSQFKHMPSLVELVEEAKKESPKLFEGCKVKNPFMATLKGYIGYGEEPYTWGSYNSVRVEILERTFEKLREEYNKDKNYLTKENIILQFNKVCEDERIDSGNFYLNKPDKFWDFDM